MSGHGIPSNYRGASEFDGFTNAMLADARSSWHRLSPAQRVVLVDSLVVRGGRVLDVAAPAQTVNALVAKGIVEPSKISRHLLTGLGTMVREAGIYTRDNPD